LIAVGAGDAAQIAAVWDQIRREVDAALEEARAAPPAAGAGLGIEDVYWPSPTAEARAWP
jgi:hypothetical protein